MSGLRWRLPPHECCFLISTCGIRFSRAGPARHGMLGWADMHPATWTGPGTPLIDQWATDSPRARGWTTFPSANQVGKALVNTAAELQEGHHLYADGRIPAMPGNGQCRCAFGIVVRHGRSPSPMDLVRNPSPALTTEGVRLRFGHSGFPVGSAKRLLRDTSQIHPPWANCRI